MYTRAAKIPRIKIIFDRRHQSGRGKQGYIEIRITYDGAQKFLSTGMKIAKKEWDEKNYQVVNRIDAEQLNLAINNTVTEIREVLLQMQKEGLVDIFAIPQRLQRLRQGDLTFVQFIEKRMDVRKFNLRKASQTHYDKFFTEFVKWGKMVYFDDISDENVIAFDRYLAAQKMKDASKWQNYHRYLNSFIMDAIDAGYHQGNPYKSVKINKDKTPHGIHRTLTPDELAKMMKWEPTSEKLGKVRDVFILQTFTGLAIGDFRQFDTKNIIEKDGMKVYVGNRRKTENTFTVPLLSPALEILEKYQNKPPIPRTDKEEQEYNRALKEVAKAVGIDKPISTHYARHTDATLLLNHGVPLHVISKVMGHSSTKITELFYAKTLPETVVKEVNKIDNKFKPQVPEGQNNNE